MSILICVENNVVQFSYSHPEKLPELIALAHVESGNNDKKIGKKGEISRYQILSQEWKHFNIHYYSVVFWKDYHIAAQVAYMKYSNILNFFHKKYKRHPNAYEFYLVWKYSLTLDMNKISYELREKAIRYYNLTFLEQTKN